MWCTRVSSQLFHCRVGGTIPRGKVGRVEAAGARGGRADSEGRHSGGQWGSAGQRAYLTTRDAFCRLSDSDFERWRLVWVLVRWTV